MKITIPVSSLREVVAVLAPIAKRTLFVGLHAINGRVQLTALGAEVSAQASVDCEIGEIGPCLLPAALTAQTLNALPDADITIATKDQHVILKCGGSQFKWQTPSGIVEPLVHDADQQPCDLDGGGLSSCLDRVEFYSKGAVHRSYATEGVNISVSGKHLYCVTVGDGGSMMAVAGTPSQNHDQEWACSLPRDSVQVVRRMLKVGPCSITTTDGAIIIQCNPYLIRCQQLAGTFPPWRKIIPTNEKPKIMIPSEVMLSALRQVGMVGDSESKRVAIALDKTTLTLSRTGSSGSSVVEIPVGEQDRVAKCGVDQTILMPAVQHAPKGESIGVYVPDDDDQDNDAPAISFDVEYPGARYYIGTMSS